MILAAGYCLYLAFALARSKDTFLQGLLFGVAFVLGMAPTLIANAMGSPLRRPMAASTLCCRS